MDVLLQSLAQRMPECLLVLSVLCLLLLAQSLFVASRLRKMQVRWRDLLTGARGDNIENILYEHLRERLQTEQEITSLENRVDKLEELIKSSKRHLGLVRFDAFEEVRGSQSFALAVYDDKGDGAVLSSIAGRTDVRVYCKPLSGGRSERDLSQEEQRAIREAQNVGPRPIVSP